MDVRDGAAQVVEASNGDRPNGIYSERPARRADPGLWPFCRASTLTVILGVAIFFLSDLLRFIFERGLTGG